QRSRLFTLTMTKERILKEFDAIFPVFKARNFDADTIVGEFDEHGNILPSTESIRWMFSRKMRSFISSALDQYALSIVERSVPEPSKRWDGYFLGGEDSPEVRAYNEGFNACREQTLNNVQ